MKLKNLIITGVLMAAGIPALTAAEAPKYVFYFIGDGMGLGHVMSTEAYNRTVLGNTDPILMLRFPVTSVATSYSASSPVTDSAAAGTALATGHKTNNGMLGVTPDTASVQSIAADLFKDGWGVGIVTSVPPDDATPGAFYAHQPKRSMYYEIGREAATCGYEFIGGSNLRGLKDKKGNPTDLLQLFAENGVEIVRGADKVKDVKGRRVMLLNTDTVRVSCIGYTIDSIAGVLTLPDMTEACLSHLERTSPERFFMMVEGGNIDHAAHSNDGGAVIKETLNFNQAIDVAYQFYQAHPEETLIVITADHNTGGMALANRHLHYWADLKMIDGQRISKDLFSDWVRAQLKNNTPVSWDEMQQVLADKMGFGTTVKLSEKQTERIRKEFVKTFEEREGKDHKTLYNTSNEFVDCVFDTMNDVAGIGFTSDAHSGDFVPVYAIGVDAERFNGLHDNTDLPKIIYSIATGK